MSGFAGKLREEFAARGAGVVISTPLRIVRALGRTRQVWFYTQPVPTSGKTSKIEELTAADWPRLMAEESFPWRHDTGASGRLHEGARLFAWREAAQLVSFGWVTHGPSLLIGELGGRVEFDQPVRWIWDCVTPAAHRGRGFYPQLLAGLVALAGDTRPVIYCTRENSSSQRGIEKAGFVRSFTITEHFLKATHRPGPMPLQYHYHRASQPA